MIASNALLKPNLLCATPTNADLNSFRPRGQKMRAEIDQDNSRTKPLPAHQIFYSPNQRTHQSLKSCGKKARNYVPAGRNCQNRKWAIFFKVKLVSGSAISSRLAAAQVSITPSWRPRLRDGTPSARAASPESWQTWRWRGREKASASGQCGKRPRQSARGSCFPECP